MSRQLFSLAPVVITVCVLNALLVGCGDSGDSSSEVNVNNTNTGSAVLSWQPPTEYSDGSVLTTSLAGYKIYYGTSGDNLTSVIIVNNPGITSYVVENLAGGQTYSFAITAFDSNGVESDYSEIGSKAV